MNYLTKYIAKQEVGPPSWILEKPIRFRKFSTSRGLCAPIKSRPKTGARNREKRKSRTPGEIAASCAQSSKVLKVRKVDRIYVGGTDEGKKFYRFHASVETPFTELVFSGEALKLVTQERAVAEESRAEVKERMAASSQEVITDWLAGLERLSTAPQQGPEPGEERSAKSEERQGGCYEIA